MKFDRETHDLQPAVFKFSYPPDNTGRALENMRLAALLAIPHLRQLPGHHGRAVIVGSGPSLEGQLGAVRELAAEPTSMVFSLNCAHTWLAQRGVPPSAHVMSEYDASVECSIGSPCPSTVYYICSHCTPDLFRVLKDHKQVLWHAWNDPPEYDQLMADLYPDEFMVACGYTTFFRTINIAIILGFRKFDFFGCECSATDDGRLYIDSYPTRYLLEDLVDVWVGEPPPSTAPKTRYRTTGFLAYQAECMRQWVAANRSRADIAVHGGGLLAHLINSKET